VRTRRERIMRKRLRRSSPTGALPQAPGFSALRQARDQKAAGGYAARFFGLGPDRRSGCFPAEPYPPVRWPHRVTVYATPSTPDRMNGAGGSVWTELSRLFFQPETSFLPAGPTL
jgi:hypothetical protein